MLYHWHELDPEVTDSEITSLTPFDARARLETSQEPLPVLRGYQRASALDHARGGPVQLTETRFHLHATNDNIPDRTAARLAADGLGVIGDPRHDARPGDYSVLNLAQRAGSGFMVALFDVGGAWTERLGQLFFGSDRSSSHRIVPNAADVATDGRADAERQRSIAARGG